MRLIEGRLELVVTAILIGSFCLHLLTISHSPSIWNDEVQILDYGRVLFNPNTDWSLTMDKKGRAGMALCPVYCATLWVWVSAFGISPTTVRLLAYLSGLLASVTFFYALRTSGLAVWPSMVGTLGLWFDGLFIRSFRGARGDAFAIALAITAWIFVNLSLERRGKQGFIYAIIAGVLGALAILSWITAIVVLIIPCALAIQHWIAERRLRASLWAGVLIGAVFVAAIYYFFYYNVFADRIRDTLRDTYWFGQIPIKIALFRAFGQQPWFPIFVLAGLIVSLIRRDKLVLAVALVLNAILIFAAPHSHEFRIVYALPAAYSVIAAAIPRSRFANTLIVIGLLLPSFMVHTAIRVAQGVAQASSRSYKLVESQLVALIPEGSVVVSPPKCDTEHYYTGLKQNWRMYALNAEAILSKAEVVYAISEHGRPLGTAFQNWSCCPILRYSTPKIREWLSGRVFSLYDIVVYRCAKNKEASDQKSSKKN